MMCGRVMLNLMRMELGLTAKWSSFSSEMVSHKVNSLHKGNIRSVYSADNSIVQSSMHIYSFMHPSIRSCIIVLHVNAMTVVFSNWESMQKIMVHAQLVTLICASIPTPVIYLRYLFEKKYFAFIFMYKKKYCIISKFIS